MTSSSIKQPSRFLLTASAVLLTLIWGTTWAAIRFSLEGFPPFKGLSIRFALGSILLFSVALVTGVRFGRARHELALWLVQTFCCFGIAFGIVYWAEQWVPSGLTSVLFATMPLFVVLFAYFILPGDRLGVLGVLGMLVGFGGVAVIFSEDLTLLGGEQVRVAAIAILLAALVVGFAEVVIKRWGRDIPTISLTAVPMGMASALLAALAWGWVETDRPIVPSSSSVAAVLYLAVFGSAVAFGLFFWLLKHVSVIQLSLITYATPVMAVLIGTLFLDEPLTVRMAVGAVFVIGGAFLVMRPGQSDGAGGSDVGDEYFDDVGGADVRRGAL